MPVFAFGEDPENRGDQDLNGRIHIGLEPAESGKLDHTTARRRRRVGRLDERDTTVGSPGDKRLTDSNRAAGGRCRLRKCLGARRGGGPEDGKRDENAFQRSHGINPLNRGER